MILMLSLLIFRTVNRIHFRVDRTFKILMPFVPCSMFCITVY